MAVTGRFGPPVALMVAIFAISAQPGLDTGLGDWDTVLRKAAHMLEFGVLWALWWRALGYGDPRLSIVIVLVYAASDELHQTFVTDRVGSPVDWCIDAAGVGLAGLLAVLVARSRASRAQSP
jgi:VanZ family protein